MQAPIMMATAMQGWGTTIMIPKAIQFGIYARYFALSPTRTKCLHAVMIEAKQDRTIAKIPEDLGMGKVGLVAAMVAALHAAADGALNSHVVAVTSKMHGYALAKMMKTAGARKIATKLAMPWASHWALGGVRRRKL